MKTKLILGLLALGLAWPAAAQGLRASASTSSTVVLTNSFAVPFNTSPGGQGAQVFSVTAYNNSASDLYLMVFDAATLPANGAVPPLVVPIPANKTGGFDWNVSGRRFATGCVAAVSTTPASLTNGTAVFLVDVTFTRN